MIYASKLIEGKEPLLNDGKAISAFKSDPLFKIDNEHHDLGLNPADEKKRGKFTVDAANNKNAIGKKKSHLDHFWESEWSVDIAALDENPVNVNKNLNIATSEIETKSKEKKSSNTEEQIKVKVNEEFFAKNRAPVISKKTVTFADVSPIGYTIEKFRGDIKGILTSLDKHITTLNIELKCQSNTSSKDKYVKISKISVLYGIRKALLDKQDFMPGDVVKIIHETAKEFPDCKKGIWMGGLFKSRTENFINDLIKETEKYSNQTYRVTRKM